MKILIAKHKVPIQIEHEVVTAKEGYKYVIPDHLASSFEGSAFFDVKDFVNEKSITGPTDFTNKRLLATRTAGYGDILFVGRSLLEIKRKFTGTYVELACSPKYASFPRECLMGTVVDEVSSILIPYSHYEKCDYFVTFEGVIESNQAAMHTNAFLLMAKKFFIDIGNDHTVPIKLPLKYEEQADKLISNYGNPESIIAMQVKASALLRTYPYDYQNQLVKLFNKRGFKTLLLDNKDSLDSLIKSGLFDKESQEYILTPYSTEIPSDILLSIALVKKCKFLVAPDSFFIYVGDSFGIPTLGIYTPIDSILRVHGLNVYALDVVGGCNNCQKHTQSPCPWSKDTWSPCMKSIKPEYVDYAISEILSGNK